MNVDQSMSSPWPAFNSRLRQSISRNFSLADHTLPTGPEPAWQKMAQSPPLGVQGYKLAPPGVSPKPGQKEGGHTWRQQEKAVNNSNVAEIRAAFAAMFGLLHWADSPNLGNGKIIHSRPVWEGLWEYMNVVANDVVYIFIVTTVV